jgi:hypothetical protein
MREKALHRTRTSKVNRFHLTCHKLWRDDVRDVPEINRETTFTKGQWNLHI